MKQEHDFSILSDCDDIDDEAGGFSPSLRVWFLIAIALAGLIYQISTSPGVRDGSRSAVVSASLESNPDSASAKQSVLPGAVNNVPSSIFDPSQHPNWRMKTLNIEDIRVGMRVPALNPQGTQYKPEAQARELAQPRAGRGSPDPAPMDLTETAFGTPDPKTWRTFRLNVEKEDHSGDVEVTLLRPADWLVEQQQSTLLLAMIAQWQLGEQSASAPISVSSAVDNVLHGWQASLFSEADYWLSEISAWSVPASNLLTASPAHGFASLVFGGIESAVIENAESELAWNAAVDDVLTGKATGSTIWLEMPELGAVGLATVTAIEPCATIKSGPGRIVTATFKHSSADVLDLKFEASVSVGSAVRTSPFDDTNAAAVSVRTADPTRSPSSNLTLGVTSLHPFWSVDREDFIPAGELLPQEQVIGIDGQHFRLTSIVPRAGPESVYNFEVALDHVYYVGEGGLLVHNLYVAEVLKNGRRVIRDTATGRITSVAALRKAKKGLQRPIVIIGEVQDRVNDFANFARKQQHGSFNASTITAWLNGRTWTDELNKQWVKEMKNNGAIFVDIGLFAGRKGGRSTPYADELSALSEYGRRVIWGDFPW